MIILFSNDDIEGLDKFLGTCLLLVEVDENGSVGREIGMDRHERIIHIHPGHGKYGKYGILDGNIVDTTISRKTVEQEKFEELWIAALENRR